MKSADDIGKQYFIFSFFVTLWASGFSIMISEGNSYENALFWGRFGHAAAYLIPVTWFHFVLIYVKKVGRFKFWVVTFYVISVAAMCFGLTKLGIRTVAPAVEFKYYYRGGMACNVFTALFCTLVPAGFYELYKKIKISSKPETYQIRGFMLASAFGFVGGGLGIPLMYDVIFPQYNLFLMPFYPFIVAYFMIKKNLFNEHELAYAAHRDKLAAMGTLAASINHEIKNPLYIIKGLAEGHLANLNDKVYFDEKQAFAKANEILQKAVIQSDRAMRIMRNFAVFAKRSSSEEPKPESVDLKHLIEELLPLIQYELKLEKVELKVEVAQNFPLLQIDRRHLEEILFNIIVNACQAMKGTGGEIRIYAGVKNKQTNICIQDNGPGISPEGVKKIFEPFYTTKEEGTGLGLHITKRLVDVNGGKIRVESQAGQGTKFILEFQIDLTTKEKR